MIRTAHALLTSLGSNPHDPVRVLESLSIFHNLESSTEIEEFDLTDKFEEEDAVSNVEGRGEALSYKVETS